MPGWYLMCVRQEQVEHFHGEAGARQGTLDLQFGNYLGDAAVLIQDSWALVFP